MKKLSILIAFTALLLPSVKSIAQRPSAILVMLKAETNRIAALEKGGQTGLANQLSGEAEIVRQKTINDFSDHFSFCPVYYFVDTNLHLIKEKKFGNVLFDKGRKMYSTSPIDVADTSFFIVYYGLDMPNIKSKNEDQTYLSNGAAMRPLKGLTVLDHQFKKIDRSPIKFLFKNEPRNPVNNQYDFASVEFNISYFQSAKKLQVMINKYQGKL
jgi:hypothetical protein